jgi:hypothetical protein
MRWVTAVSLGTTDPRQPGSELKVRHNRALLKARDRVNDDGGLFRRRTSVAIIVDQDRIFRAPFPSP